MAGEMVSIIDTVQEMMKEEAMAQEERNVASGVNQEKLKIELFMAQEDRRASIAVSQEKVIEVMDANVQEVMMGTMIMAQEDMTREKKVEPMVNLMTQKNIGGIDY